MSNRTDFENVAHAIAADAMKRIETELHNAYVAGQETVRDSHTPEARIETQASISVWANDVFGPTGSNARVAARANEEMAELLRALTADDTSEKAKAEIADIVIILYRLATRLGVDLHAEVDRKMVINRTREWKRDGTGHGYHIREKENGVEKARKEAFDAGVRFALDSFSRAVEDSNASDPTTSETP